MNFPLPRDITIQILLLLPPESILACKCVSKQWKNLINDPEFTKLYPPKFPPLVLCKNKIYCISKRQDEISILPSIKLRLTPFSIRKGHDLLQESSSNRIACVRAENGNLLCYNLLTGDSYGVPLPTLVRESNFVFLTYGFGDDRYDDDYKILMVCPRKYRYLLRMSTLEDPHCTQIFVYSFRNRCWESIIGFPCDADISYSLRSKAYSFKGALHWVMHKRDYEESVIVALDLQSYRLVEMELPEDGCFLKNNVAELDDQLCCSSFVGPYFELWVMKEYGVKESWTRLLSIRRSQLVYCRRCDHITPTAIYERKDGGKFVLFVSYCRKVKLFLYDIDNDMIINIVDETARGKVRTLRVMKTRFEAAIGKMGCWS